MKKIVLFTAVCACSLLTALGISVIVAEDGTATYTGIARTDRNLAAPSTNDAVWRVIRKVESSTGNYTYKTAYLTNSVGNMVETIAWTNRAGTNVVYK